MFCSVLVGNNKIQEMIAAQEVSLRLVCAQGCRLFRTLSSAALLIAYLLLSNACLLALPRTLLWEVRTRVYAMHEFVRRGRG